MAYKGWRVCYKDRSGLVAARNLENRSANESYREFDDEASGGWTYEGDGREQVDWFMRNSNVDDLIRQMNYDDINAFRGWGEGWFMDGQQWRGWDNMGEFEREMTRSFDKVLDRSQLSDGVTLARLGSAELILGEGNTHALSLEQLKALEGRNVFAKGSMSFGAAKHGLTIGGDKNVEYKLKIPKGAVGAGMWIGDSRINGHGPRQREFMTYRDVWYTVGKTTYDSRRGVYVVELRYTGREKHDYGRNGR